MHQEEILLFSEAQNLVKDEFYFDAIEVFSNLIKKYPDSELTDDAFFNIGLCYFQLNQFQNAITNFNKVIEEFPDATISILDGGKEFGRTSAKCYYAIINCYLGLKKFDDIQDILQKLDSYEDSYVRISENEKYTFKQLAEKSINIYNSNT